MEQRDRLDELFVAHYDALRAAVRRHLARQPAGVSLTATGFLHDVYARLHGQRSRDYANTGAFRTAFWVTVQRSLHDHIRRGRRLKRPPKEGRRSLDAVPETEVLAAPVQVVQSEVRELLLQLDDVDPDLAWATVLKWGLEFTTQEVAGELGLSFDQTRRRLARAREIMLRKLLVEGAE